VCGIGAPVSVAGEWQETAEGKRYFYRLTFTPDEISALHFLGPRGYCGASVLLGCLDADTGECVLAEHEAHEWREAAIDDGERHTNEEWPYFTCAALPLVRKLTELYERIV
jgi:hypothetical protein